MSRTMTIPLESVVSFNKHGIVKIEHLKYFINKYLKYKEDTENAENLKN